MRKMFEATPGAVLSLAALALAAPTAAEVPTAAQAPTAPPKPQKTSHLVTFKYPPKAERKPVPFELVNGVFVFKAKLRGQPVWAILDNASDMSLIDSQFAADQKIAVGPLASPMVTANGKVERRIALECDDVSLTRIRSF